HHAAQAERRFHSGLPAAHVARALGLDGGAMCLDAACASALYAIKIACDRLRDGDLDLALAGAVNRADDLFIHVGFCALQALSKSGRSRPFHRDADGLMPAEGAAVLALKRLDDAERDGDPILGVIRGVGLSNDGRGRGLLVPTQEGQARAMRLAFDEAGLSPGDVSLIECHATGTSVGDATELGSMAQVYGAQSGLPIGSLKSNMGHLITAAGAAGLIKVLAAMKAQKRPPTLHVDVPNPALEGGPFRLLRALEDWPSEGPRRAAVSAFGFGGNNAHLLVEEYLGPAARPVSAPSVVTPKPKVTVVAIGAAIGPALGEAPLLRAAAGERVAHRALEVELPLTGLRTPPNDLKRCLGQQTLLLRATFDALSSLGERPRERAGVFIGMGVDAEVARYGMRWRLPGWFEALGVSDAAAVTAAQDGVLPALDAAGVLGTMPNIPANRLSGQFDLAGPGFTISSEERSGLDALDLAVRALQAGELDLAVVGAVDLSDEPVHLAALAALGVSAPDGALSGDAAVVLVLRRSDDVGDGRVICTIEGAQGLAEAKAPRAAAPRAHAAEGLVQLAAAALAIEAGLGEGRPSRAARVEVSVPVLDAPPARVVLGAPPRRRGYAPDAPVVTGFAAADRAGLLRALDGDGGGDGPARLALVSRTDAELVALKAEVRQALQSGGALPSGAVMFERPVEGQLAAVFTAPGPSYDGMGQGLRLALPELFDEAIFSVGLGGAERLLDQPRTVLEKLWGASTLIQAHARLSLELLGLKPQLALGYCSGESNALLAFGVWSDAAGLARDTLTSGLFTEALGGPMSAVAQAWGESAPAWDVRAVAASAESVRAALHNEPRAHLTLINSPTDCVIAGAPEALDRVVGRLGVVAQPVVYPLVVHCPEVEQVAAPWRALHLRPSAPRPDVRFYSAGVGGAYEPSAENNAEAILNQSRRTVDWPALVRQAYADGARIFVEHGPRDLCARWIREILGDAPHLVVSYDRRGQDPLQQAALVAATLWAAGQPVNLLAWRDRLRSCAPSPAPRLVGPTVRVAAHSPEVVLPPLSAAPSVAPVAVRPFAPPAEGGFMAPAPTLPPILGVSAPPVLQAPSAPQVATQHSAPAVQRAVSVESPPPAAQVVVTQHAPMTLPPGVWTPATVVAMQSARVAQVQADFLRQQADVHAQFMALRAAQAEALFLGFAGVAPGVVSALPQSLAPAAPPVSAPAAPVAAAPPAPVAAAPVAAAPAPAAPVAPKPIPAAPVVAAPVVTPVKPPAVPEAPAAELVAAPTKVHVNNDTLPGLRISREQLEHMSHDTISAVFGPEFVPQDGYSVQVRMPTPPLLLCDRVTGIDAAPLSMGTGTIWTETDVGSQTWYLHGGRMPPGVLIESGQADLLLISYLGVDMLNQGERAYRLLGCELTYHRSLPRPGETLRYDIHVDGHANQGAVRLFFFHYDCRIDGELMLTVRRGQAGFFTKQELAESMGVLWDAATAPALPGCRVDPPAVKSVRGQLSGAQLHAFSEGRMVECFGPGYERGETHSSPPTIQGGRMLFLEEVTHLDPKGGPWGRGYLRAVDRIRPDDWFFKGHFHNDPCMPGTLMFDGCLQAMALYVAALGYTLDRDGWRFEPVTGETYNLRCRGQVTPTSQELVYELFVEEVHDGPFPTLYADLLCTVDGLKAFHCRRMGLRLVPDWPLARWTHLLKDHGHDGPHAVIDGFHFDYASLMACAWGRPSLAFGPMYEVFDSTRKVARLPGPPYHFMSRVSKINGPIGVCQPGAEIELEYDIPERVWYFDQNGCPSMPFAVLLEAALQPCGWLASFVGSARTTDLDLYFRNLDGTATWHRELTPGCGSLRTQVKITNVSMSGGMIIQSFKVVCLLGDEKVYTMDTVFGFFPKVALENQIGLPSSPEQKALLTDAAPISVDLRRRPARFCAAEPRLPGPMLLMLDRVGIWDEGGAKGLGRLRGEKDVDPKEWFFKAHFFQDPVQPGSLGLEAFVQLLQVFMLHRGMAEGVEAPRFEPLAIGRAISWKYRGQVVPTNKLISSTLDVIEVGRDERGPYVLADASLWVDGKRIYEGKNFGMRIVSGALHQPRFTMTLDPVQDAWLGDHRPTFTLPALPMMSMVDQLAEAALGQSEGRLVAALEDVRVRRWMVLDGPRTVQAEIGGRWERAEVTLSDEHGPYASGAVILRQERFEAPAAWGSVEGEEAPDLYASGALFHGPAFQGVTRLVIGDRGSSAWVDAAKITVPQGALGQGLLDVMTHGIPHDRLSRWAPELGDDVVAYPAIIPGLRLYAELPRTGMLRVEARFAGVQPGGRFVAVDLQLIQGAVVLAELRLIEALFPKGPLGRMAPEDRAAFLRDRAFVEGAGLGVERPEGVAVERAALRQSDWLPGTIASLYALTPEERVSEDSVLAAVAAREALGARLRVHPAEVTVRDGGVAWAGYPLSLYPVAVQVSAEGATASLSGPPAIQLGPVERYWSARFDLGRWPVEDLYYGLIRRYVRGVIVQDPQAHAQLRGRPLLYLANHQVGVESLLFSVLASALNALPTVTLAKAEHRASWLGDLIRECFTWPGVVDPQVITYFDRDDKASLPAIIQELAAEMAAGERSVMVHVEGTRSLECRTPVQKMSGAFIDLALNVGAPIVPVRFVGGLPTEPLDRRVELPLNHGQQTIHLGRPILPEELAASHYGERKRRVLDAINGLGPDNAVETPHAGDLNFAARARAWAAEAQVSEEDAALWQVLEEHPAPCAEVMAFRDAVRRGHRPAVTGEKGAWLRGFARRVLGARAGGEE
ncbi:polyketide synthase dehydratase domain-containing protein, partial [Myxococcota bacterium]|nr:polyketide synthase dehydratase domain-containing protein [Myxococcota bacterium]